MVEFITELLNASDYAELLGDLYQPVCACIVVSFAVLAFGGFVQAFANLFSVFFRGRQ